VILVRGALVCGLKIFHRLLEGCYGLFCIILGCRRLLRRFGLDGSYPRGFLLMAAISPIGERIRSALP
jgi:hypothetical protein